MEKKETSLDNVKLEVALEILAMKIALTISSDNSEELSKLLIEQKRIYSYDEKIIDKVLNVYGSEIKSLLMGKN